MKTQYPIDFKRLALISAFFVLGGCVTKFPSNYELDRRSGSTPAGGTPGLESLSNYSLRDAPMTPEYMPVRSQPVVTKVWVYDRRLGPNWLQGTWMFIEVQPSQWVTELEPRSNNFVQRYAADGTPEIKSNEKSGDKAPPADNKPAHRAPAPHRGKPLSAPRSKAGNEVQEPTSSSEQAQLPRRLRRNAEEVEVREDEATSRRMRRLIGEREIEDQQSPESFQHHSRPQKSRRHD